VVSTTITLGAPALMSVVPMNWAEPANTSDDMASAGKGGKPAPVANTP